MKGGLAADPARSVDSAHLRLLACAISPFLVAAIWHVVHPLDLSIGDQAHYLLHARAIASGSSYTDNGYIYNPRIGISPAAYPPGLPLLIALVFSCGGSLLAVRILLVCCAVSFLYVAGRYFCRLGDRRIAFACIVATGLLEPIPAVSAGVYSDLLFAAFIWVSFLVVDTDIEWSGRRMAALSVSGSCAILVRTAGIALIPALVLHEILHRPSNRTRAIVPLASWVGTYLAIDLLLPVSGGYAHEVVSKASIGGSVSHTLLTRILECREFVSEVQMTPFRLPAVNSLYHLLALILLCVGLVAWIRRKGMSLSVCFSLAYAVMLVAVPWPNVRLLWPLAPLIWYLTLSGGQTVIARALRVPSPSAARVAAASGLLISGLALFYGPRVAVSAGVGATAEGRELYSWFRRKKSVEAVRAVFAYPRVLALEAGVQSMGVPDTQADSLLGEFRAYHITHVIVGNSGLSDNYQRAIAQLVSRYPSQFNLEFANDSFQVYHYSPRRR